MGLPHYLAMTPEEFANSSSLPKHIAWMSCRFSTETTGLTQLPRQLPAGSILVLEDSIPPSGHDPVVILRDAEPYLRDLRGILLDFQKPDNPETAAIAKALATALPCPVGISQFYASGLDCPIFLPPAPLHIPLEEYLAPYTNREIWLEAALCREEILVTETGTEFRSISSAQELSGSFYDHTLHCNYRTQLSGNAVTFTLFDTRTSLQEKLAHAQSLGVKLTIGLWQELGDY